MSIKAVLYLLQADSFLVSVTFFLTHKLRILSSLSLSRPISVVYHYTQRYRLLLHQNQRRSTHSTFQRKQQDREIMKKIPEQTSVERKKKKSFSNFTFFFTPREKHPPPASFFLCIHLIQSQNLDHSLIIWSGDKG